MKFRATLLTSLLVTSSLLLSACDDSGSNNEATAEKATSILGGKATIVLPPDFVKMPETLLETKYPMKEKRPQEAWYVESEGAKVSIAFSQTQTKVPESEVSRLAGVLKLQMSMFTPVVSDLKVNGKKMSRLEMTTPAADAKIFNVMQISSMDEKMLISTFNVTEDLKDKYTEAGKASLSTLKY